MRILIAAGLAAYAAAQAPATAQSIKAFTIGALHAVALKDGDIEMPNDGKAVFAGDPEPIAAALRAHGLKPDTVQFSVQPLLVTGGGLVLLFDTGAGANVGPGAGKLPLALKAAQVDPARVTDIFITHAHLDHVGGLLMPQGTAAFPNATIHLSKPEWTWLSGLGAKTAAVQGLKDYHALIAAMRGHVAAFDPGAVLIPGVVTAVPVRGHTPGHSAYRITSGKASLLDIGDSAHHYVISLGMPGRLINFDMDQPLGARSRQALLAQLAATHQRLYAGHFPFPGVGTIEKEGSGYIWKPEP